MLAVRHSVHIRADKLEFIAKIEIFPFAGLSISLIYTAFRVVIHNFRPFFHFHTRNIFPGRKSILIYAKFYKIAFFFTTNIKS